jgi:UDP-N-acetylmuramate dehydrogenase
MQFLEEVTLAPYTTFQIGGPARWFAEAAGEDDIAAGIAFASERQLPLFILGGGSNLLVSDAGFSGLVLRIALRGIASAQEGGRWTFSAAAGEDWDGFVAHAVAANCSGVECLSGIPRQLGRNQHGIQHHRGRKRGQRHSGCELDLSVTRSTTVRYRSPFSS